MLYPENLPMAGPNESKLCRLIHCLGGVVFFVILLVLGLVVMQSIRLLSKLDFGIADTPPSFTSTGPTLV
jgi:hypothetical protein